jgi:hypothetical protein
MMLDLGLHIPGVKGLFDSCEEITRRTKLPHEDKKHIPGGIPRVLEIRQRRTGQPLGHIPWADAVIKFQ